ncbi:hypothetical protein BT63DRAFT_273161 [Microthyrium microscopicum]|uniref:Zn(2)-C6 fungal-type domain-containing protein n=1 Tax=Microthyrium microscopicum TaxID=703497 RepID=A0A6A6U7U6_9PEZI|nr:hypothetical protein BT63DRAFT_273161 [Microthyrium microscopicum]
MNNIPEHNQDGLSSGDSAIMAGQPTSIFGLPEPDDQDQHKVTIPGSAKIPTKSSKADQVNDAEDDVANIDYSSSLSSERPDSEDDLEKQDVFETLEDDDDTGFGIEDLFGSEDDEDIDKYRGEEGEDNWFNVKERLRKRIKNVPISYYDEDKSGTFNPHPEKKRKRKKPSGDESRTRKFKTCTECRLAEEECSLKEWSDEPPCESCADADIACTFLGLRDVKRKLGAANKGKSKATTKGAEMSTSTDSSEESEDSAAEEPEDTSLPSISVNTGLAHPVSFFCRSADCKWCMHTSYGVLMPGFKTNVTVRPTADGLQWHEASDNSGNRSVGHPPSKMCLDCCETRISIIACPRRHDIKEIPGAMHMSKASRSQYQAAFSRLLRNEMKESDVWCSVCPNLAIHTCQAKRHHDGFGNKLDPRDEKANGCGLKLCDWCAQGLSEMNGNFEAFVNKMMSEERDKARYKLGPRPDAELLSGKGLLLKNLIAKKKS